MNMKPSDLQLYLVTDRSWIGEEQLEAHVTEAVKSGVTFLQYREKNLSWDENIRLASSLKTLASKQNIPFVINDDIDLAIALDADGIHVGQDDLEASQARLRLGADKIIGVSVKSVEEALKAQEAGANYLGVGAMFPTGTKLDANSVSFETLKSICEATELPVVAIGGIQKGNLQQLEGSGIWGVAVVSAILATDDRRTATRELHALSEVFVK